MKKLLAILLALTMVMSLAACGSDSKDEDKDDKKTEAADSVDKEDNDEDNKADASRKALDDYIAVACEYDEDLYESVVPDEIWEYYAEMNDMTKDEFIEYSYDLDMELYEEYNITTECEVLSYEKADEDKTDEIISDIVINYDFIEESDIGDVVYGAVVKVELSVNGEAQEPEEGTVYIVEFDGIWYVVSENGEFSVS